jgi:hypothetical protein
MQSIIEPTDLSTRRFVVSGRLIRIASVWDEEWLEGELVPDPDAFVRALRNDRLADIFAFSPALPQTDRLYQYPHLVENHAVVRLSSFNDWWEGLPQESRKNVRRSQRRGVTTSTAPFDSGLVSGITTIYNESPVRQGRRFKHYGKSLEAAEAENQSYLDRSIFLAAYLGSELVGFAKLVIVDSVGRIMQILSLERHVDKRPTNALIAKAVEVCCDRKLNYLIYGRYVYGNKENSPMTEFKRRNGFERLNYPRYFAPVTSAGSVAIRCRLHLGLSRLLPERILTFFLHRRACFYARKFGTPYQKGV